jgi:mRNA-degrading endonuclease RelE of RelBE toxin-antitoxin system
MLQVIITPKAQKQYEHIPAAEQSKIKRKLIALGNDPYVGKKLSGELAELRSLKAWPYRIIYYINQDKVFVTSIIHRQGAYQ